MLKINQSSVGVFCVVGEEEEGSGAEGGGEGGVRRSSQEEVRVWRGDRRNHE